MSADLLPPGSSYLERSLADASARLSDVPAPIRSLWDPATCPRELLPFLAFGVSIDFWDTDWTEAEKRTAIAGAIEAQRRKGTPASLREVLDRFDPMIGLVEWFEDKDTLAPHTFRLELPLAADPAVECDTALVNALLRDIYAVKPLRAHMEAVHSLRLQAHAGILGAAHAAGFGRLDMTADTASATDPFWDALLQTEDGEPLTGGAAEYLEHN